MAHCSSQAVQAWPNAAAKLTVNLKGEVWAISHHSPCRHLLISQFFSKGRRLPPPLWPVPRSRICKLWNLVISYPTPFADDGSVHAHVSGINRRYSISLHLKVLFLGHLRSDCEMCFQVVTVEGKLLCWMHPTKDSIVYIHNQRRMCF